MNNWSMNYQNEEYLEKTRMMIMNPYLRLNIIDWIGIKKGMKVLDLGCGTGAFTYYLASGTRDVKYIGIDNDDNFIKYANQKSKTELNNDISFHIGDARKLEFRDSEFDIVVSQTFLHAVKEYYDVLYEMKRVCKNNGIIASLNVDLRYARVDTGTYDSKEYSWKNKYDLLTKTFNDIFFKTIDISNTRRGIDPMRLPYVFSEIGLSNISVYPISSFFSLSNSAMSNEDKTNFIELDYIAEIKRIDNFNTIYENVLRENNFDIDEYKNILLERKLSLLNHLNDNNTWESFNTYSNLVVGKNEE